MTAMGELREMQFQHGDPIKLIKIDDDILHPVFFPPIEDKLDHIRDMEQKDGDILLCRYPKCGGHWLMANISKLMNKQCLKGGGKVTKIVTHGLEFESTYDYFSADGPRFLTSHLWPKRMPKYFMGGKAKVVLLLRNPKDVAVSFYHHLKNATDIGNKQSWEEYFNSYVSGDIMFGGYHNYLKAWEHELNNNKRLNIAVFYYEDFKEDTFKQTKMLADYLDVNLTEIELNEIIDESSFTKLKEKDNSKGNTLPKFETDLSRKSVIYRKGTVGDWKHYFSVAQSEQYDHVFNTTLTGEVFTFKFE